MGCVAFPKGDQMTESQPLCVRCRHYLGAGVSGFEYLAHTCDACPDGIPREVLDGDPRLNPANSQCKLEIC